MIIGGYGVSMRYCIRYNITGYDEEFESPSYSKEEVDSHLFDIAGYEGVYVAHIELFPELEDQ